MHIKLADGTKRKYFLSIPSYYSGCEHFVLVVNIPITIYQCCPLQYK